MWHDATTLTRPGDSGHRASIRAVTMDASWPSRDHPRMCSFGRQAALRYPRSSTRSWSS